MAGRVRRTSLFGLVPPRSVTRGELLKRRAAMKVKDVMTAGPKACLPETSLAEAAATMWENDCGALPVVGAEDRVVGMITDRDICFGATTKNRPPSEVSVAEVITGKLFA